MGELRLVGLHEDGEHVVLEGVDGQRFRLPIDEALRAAVRRDRPVLEQLRSGAAGALSAKEIQARIRAGASAEDVAADSGTAVELVRRYEGPVLAEREFVAGQAQATRIGHESGAPFLGELVTDRLATRGVPADSIRWEAYRPGSGSWTVEVLFEVGETPRSARWTFDQQARSVRALDDEARWLSETEIDEGPIPRRHLAAVRDPFDAEVDAALRPLLASVDRTAPAEPEPEPDPHAILDELTDRRGVRVPVSEPDELEDDDEVFDGFGPQHAFDFENPDLTVPAAHPPHSRPDLATDATVLTMRPGGRRPVEPADSTATPVTAGSAPSAVTPEEPAEAAETPAAPEAPAAAEAGGAAGTEVAASAVAASAGPPPRSRSRKGRASVPSWDEIVFGAKPD